MNEMSLFTAKGMETFKIAGAISIGIIFGFSIPQRLFQIKQNGFPSKPEKYACKSKK